MWTYFGVAVGGCGGLLRALRSNPIGATGVWTQFPAGYPYHQCAGLFPDGFSVL